MLDQIAYYHFSNIDNHKSPKQNFNDNSDNSINSDIFTALVTNQVEKKSYLYESKQLTDQNHIHAPIKTIAATIGNFDGMHQGHKGLIQALQNFAKPKNLPCWLITFQPHPRFFFDKTLHNFTITPLNQKLFYAKTWGLDGVVVLPFTQALASLTAIEFIQQILQQQLNVGALVVGADFHFGKGRDGNAQTLKTYIPDTFALPLIANQLNPKTADVVRPTSIISSSRIRQAIYQAQIQQATELLGHALVISGRVVKGDGFGKTFGFATANLQLSPDLNLGPNFKQPNLTQAAMAQPLQQNQIFPPSGIYAVHAILTNDKQKPISQLLQGVCYIGDRPTLENLKPNQHTMRLEVHLFNWQADCYGMDCHVAFQDFIRPDKKFPDLKSMQQGMAQDCEVAKKLLAKTELKRT